MKLNEVARYWAARELTRIERTANRVELRAPFACPAFTVRFAGPANAQPRVVRGTQPPMSYPQVQRLLGLKSNTWHRDGEMLTVCFDLSKGANTLDLT
jgi:hypothetical protein